MRNGKITAILVRPHHHPETIEITPRASEFCSLLKFDAIKSPKSLPEHFGVQDVFFITKLDCHRGDHDFNRTIRGKDDMVLDFICGDFMIVGKDPATGTVATLSQQRIEQFMELFWPPETLAIKGGNLVVARERKAA